ncbi:MAG: hypothetical protein HPY65_04945 [Syntrophaceae bacterium]|nr:hypothetical protein [Syntrophaceae bacterium]
MTGEGMPEGRRVIDLVDVLEEGVSVFSGREAPSPHERASAAEPRKIHDLTEVVKDIPVRAVADPALREMVLQHVSEIAERLAREMIPGIAERVIREEIEKLKAMDGP